MVVKPKGSEGMTDNEITKALEHCCGDSNTNEECSEHICYQATLPEDRNGDIRWCRQWLMKDALDLINRQKSEIEMMRNYIHDNNLEYDLLSYSKRNGG